MQPMVSDKNTKEYVQRLNQALDAAHADDPPHRIAWISRTFNVSMEAARKWMRGLNYPGRKHETIICQRLGVSSTWLHTGQDPSMAEYPVHIPHANSSDMQVSESAPTSLSPDLYASRLAWQAFIHRGAGYVTSGDLSAEDIDALGKIMHQLAVPHRK